MPQVRRIVDNLVVSEDVTQWFGDNKKVQQVLRACQTDAHIQIDSLVTMAAGTIKAERGVCVRESTARTGGCRGTKGRFQQAEGSPHIYTSRVSVLTRFQFTFNQHHGDPAKITLGRAADRVTTVVDSAIGGWVGGVTV